MIPGYDYDVALAVIEEAVAQQLPPLLLLALAHGEGGLRRPFPVGDGGTSFGPFQVHVPAHGGTREHWENPVNAIRLMVSRWRRAFQAAGGWLAWWYDKYAFIERWAPDAQGSVAWTPDKARRCVGEACDTLELVRREQLRRAGGGGERVRALEQILAGLIGAGRNGVAELVRRLDEAEQAAAQ
jgi:hypothetical protein